jgi:hypothetical protein
MLLQVNTISRKYIDLVLSTEIQNFALSQATTKHIVDMKFEFFQSRIQPDEKRRNMREVERPQVHTGSPRVSARTAELCDNTVHIRLHYVCTGPRS